MPYQFPPDLERLVEEQMATGGYDTEDDVLRDALRALSLRNEEVAAIQECIDDMEACRFRSLEEVDAEIRAKQKFPLA